MHAEAVRYGATPSRPGLILEESRPATCSECDVNYHLYFDSEAAISATFYSILADEIITARHPDHNSNVALELAPPDWEQAPKQKVVWSVRLKLPTSLNKKSDRP
jgi:hypothetical protein